MKKGIIILLVSAIVILCAVYLCLSTSYLVEVKGETYRYYNGSPLILPTFFFGYSLVLAGSVVLGKEVKDRTE